MSQAMIIAVGTFTGVLLLLYLAYALIKPRKSAVQERLDELRKPKFDYASEVTLDTARHEDTPLQKSAAVVGSALPLSQMTISTYRLKLIQAGYRKPSAPVAFFGAKVALGMAFFAITFMYTMTAKQDLRLALILGIIGFIVGLVLPNVWLNEKLRKRAINIFHSLPDVLDLLTVCVEAGLGLDAAIIKITEERQFSKQILAREFGLVSQEVRAGKPRTDALRDLGTRTGVEDIKALVALLIQTERLGASLARSLRVHSDSLRTKRRQIAEEAAAKTSIKLIFPLAFFIFPSLLVVLLGPAAIKMFDMLFGYVIK